jgi:hypothetical protein
MPSTSSEQGQAGTDGRRAADASLGELFHQLSGDLSTLVRQEIEHAKAEMARKARFAAMGTALLVASAVIAVAAFAVLTAAAVLALSIVLDGWLAALVVGAAYLAIAGILALVGRGAVREVGSPVPERTVESVKEDVKWVRSPSSSNSR